MAGKDKQLSPQEIEAMLASPVRRGGHSAPFSEIGMEIMKEAVRKRKKVFIVAGKKYHLSYDDKNERYYFKPDDGFIPAGWRAYDR